VLTLLSVFLIYSTPFEEVAQGPKPPGEMPKKQAEQEFGLKGGKTIVVKQIEFSGNQAIPTAQLKNLTRPFLNHPLSETDLFEIKQRIKLLYRSKGHPEPKVSIPPKQKSHILTVIIQEVKK